VPNRQILKHKKVLEGTKWTTIILPISKAFVTLKVSVEFLTISKAEANGLKSAFGLNERLAEDSRSESIILNAVFIGSNTRFKLLEVLASCDPIRQARTIVSLYYSDLSHWKHRIVNA
jgi:hypothetical protein